MIDTIYNFLSVSSNLATAGQPDEQELHAIGLAGFEVVINLGLADAEYAVAEEQNILTGYGIEYIHIPVSFENPEVEEFHRFSACFATLAGRRVFLHCAANKRVSVFLALHRILNESWPVDHAMAAVHEIWTPNEVWQTFIRQILNEIRST